MKIKLKLIPGSHQDSSWPPHFMVRMRLSSQRWVKMQDILTLQVNKSIENSHTWGSGRGQLRMFRVKENRAVKARLKETVLLSWSDRVSILNFNLKMRGLLHQFLWNQKWVFRIADRTKIIAKGWWALKLSLKALSRIQERIEFSPLLKEGGDGLLNLNNNS